jgi:outer membrane protein assembly factor BamB
MTALNIRWPFPTIMSTISILSLATWSSIQAGQWPSWRGPADHGSTAEGTFPVQWNATSNLVWKVSLPGKGCSTPIVWQERIYVTAPIHGENGLLAFNSKGQALWHVTAGAETPGKHRNGSGSNPSPVTDGQGIFVYFKSGHLAAVNLDGKLRWKTNLVERFGKDTLYWDYGTSPVLTSRDVIVAMMHHGESWLAAFDKESGQMRWRVLRNYSTPVENDHSYATPLLIEHSGKQALLVWGAEHLTAHHAADGQLIWSCGDFNPEAKANWVAVSSPVVIGDMAVVPYGRGSRLHGIRLGGKGDVTKSHRIWKREDTGTFVPSPVVYKNRVYLVRDRGEVECINPATGETLWKADFPRDRASFYSSPLIAGGKLYAGREDGVIFVARIEDSFELLAQNDLGERFIASPVPFGSRLLLRGEQHLYCVGSK